MDDDCWRRGRRQKRRRRAGVTGSIRRLGAAVLGVNFGVAVWFQVNFDLEGRVGLQRREEDWPLLAQRLLRQLVRLGWRRTRQGEREELEELPLFFSMTSFNQLIGGSTTVMSQKNVRPTGRVVLLKTEGRSG